MSQHFDYIVVGAGSAGATLATRLAQRVQGRVLLLEAGARRENDLWIRVPIGLAKTLMKPKYAWHFNTEPQANLAGQNRFLAARSPGRRIRFGQRQRTRSR